MKKLNYTLLELLASMTIFIIMMGILFKTFTASADVASVETTRLSIMNDSNVFFQYLTSDVRSLSVDIIPAPESDKGLKYRLDTAENDSTSYDFDIKKLLVTPSPVVPTSNVTLEFYSEVTAYNINGVFDVDSDGIPEVTPYIVYEFDSTAGTITRKHFTDDTKVSPDDTSTYGSGKEPIILEGVTAFDISVWDDYPGGNEITTFPTPTKPSCITFSVTLTTSNPYASSSIKTRAQRTISKTIYLKR